MKRVMALVLVLTLVLGASVPALSETQKYKFALTTSVKKLSEPATKAGEEKLEEVYYVSAFRSIVDEDGVTRTSTAVSGDKAEFRGLFSKSLTDYATEKIFITHYTTKPEVALYLDKKAKGGHNYYLAARAQKKQRSHLLPSGWAVDSVTGGTYWAVLLADGSLCVCISPFSNREVFV